MTPAPRRLMLGLTLSIALFVGIAWVVFERVVRLPPVAPPAPAARPVALEAVDAEAVVELVRGSVLRSVKGGWATVAAGDKLHADDSVRTEKDGRADLRIGDKSHIAVEQGSQFAIHELTEKVHRFKLTRGHVRVDYAPDGERLLRIEAEDGGAVAETRSAKFSVLSSGRAIAIATSSGSVELKAQGREVRVEAGLQAIAHAGQPPGPPQPIPASLWLKVANALPAPPEGICAEIRGSAPPGSEVTVDGRAVDLDSQGTFVTRVPRKTDQAEAEVAIRDAAGRTTTQMVPCGELGGVNDVALRWHGKGQ